jgi:hypothetical protein
MRSSAVSVVVGGYNIPFLVGAGAHKKHCSIFTVERKYRSHFFREWRNETTDWRPRTLQTAENPPLPRDCWHIFAPLLSLAEQSAFHRCAPLSDLGYAAAAAADFH